MDECMAFPKTVDEFLEQYKVVDTEHVYTNGTEFVPIFRMKQWFEHIAQQSTMGQVNWIPCSERLPEKPCYCLTSNEYSNVCEDFYWGEDSFEKANKYHYEVLAWMPLPEPYKGGETE